MRQTSSSIPLITDFRTALSFLTLVPCAPKTFKEDGLARSMIFFPVVGFLIALAALGIFSAAQIYFPHRVAVLALLAVPVLLSGGLHLDGLADFCDGFGGGKNKEDILRIMKDPRAGSFGVIGTALVLIAKFELLAALPEPKFFILALGASRGMQVVLSFYHPYAGSRGLASSVAEKLTYRELAGAAIFLLPAFVWAGFQGLAAAAVWIAFAFIFGAYAQRKIGGITGDVLGAASEFSEILVLLCLAAGGARV